MRALLPLLSPLFGLLLSARAEAPVVLPLWPGDPPDDPRKLTEPEGDTSKPDAHRVAGRPVIRLGHVARPELHVFPAPAASRHGAAVIICPGGGYNILAWDLEGTEVAAWLNSLGVTAGVVKYRVPTSQLTPRHRLPVQDAQRALSLLRHRAAEWGVRPDRVAVLGFSAGGDAAARTAYDRAGRLYAPVDAADAQSCRPDAAILIYTAYQVDRDAKAVRADLEIAPGAPPAFLAHAWDDPIPVENALVLASRLKEAKVPAEVHLYDRGGHGYGLRPTDLPVTRWPQRCEEWLRVRGWLTP
jgi:acetyl esterase/lipase